MTFGVLAAVAASSSNSNDVEPGVLGFLVVAAIGVALVFLLRSMNKQFRKLGPEPGQPGGPGEPSGGSAGASGSSSPSQHLEGSAESSAASQHQTVGQETPK